MILEFSLVARRSSFLCFAWSSKGSVSEARNPVLKPLGRPKPYRGALNHPWTRYEMRLFIKASVWLLLVREYGGMVALRASTIPLSFSNYVHPREGSMLSQGEMSHFIPNRFTLIFSFYICFFFPMLFFRRYFLFLFFLIIKPL